jgi:phenylacetate-CoA ligase
LSYEPLRRELYVSVFDMDEERLPVIRERIAETGARFLHGYPSALAVLARSYLAAGEAPPRLAGVFCVSENLYPQQRAELQSVFGAPVSTLYAMSERCVFAAECHIPESMHVDETYGLVELIDEDGAVIKEPGRQGEIVATGLLSACVPLVRYRTGDFASWIGDPCECGRVTRALSRVEGWRAREFLLTKSGSRIYFVAINLHSRVFDPVVKYRFVQEKPGTADLLVVPGTGWGEQPRARIAQEIEGKLGGQVEVSLVEVDEIPLTARGKHVYIEQRCAVDES